MKFKMEIKFEIEYDVDLCNYGVIGIDEAVDIAQAMTIDKEQAEDDPLEFISLFDDAKVTVKIENE